MSLARKILSLLGLLCLSFSAFAFVVTDCPSADYINSNPQFLRLGHAIMPGLGPVTFYTKGGYSRLDPVGDWVGTEVFSGIVYCIYQRPQDPVYFGVSFKTDSKNWKPQSNGEPPWYGGNRKCQLSRTQCLVTNN
jgi:hypothetical protein